MATLIIAVVATAAAVASTIFAGISLIMLGRQTRSLSDQVRLQAEQTAENNELTKANVSLNISLMMHRLSKLLLDHPRLRAYIYDGRPLPSREPLRSEVLLIAEMFIDLMTMTIDHEPVFSVSDYACWCNYFRDLLKTSPSLRYWYAGTKNWYEPHVRDRLDSFVDAEMTARPPSTAAISWRLRRSALGRSKMSRHIMPGIIGDRPPHGGTHSDPMPNAASGHLYEGSEH
jgi:hypothetical protein